MLKGWSEVDADMVELNNNAAAFRLQEDKPHIEGIMQEIYDTMFYGNEGSEPEAFTGFASYYNSLSAPNAENIIAGGGSGTDNGSIWLIVWSPTTVHGIVPKGTTAGLKFIDHGKQVLQDASDGSNTGRMTVYRSEYTMHAGLCLRDWRYAVRIPNIDKSALTKDASSGADLPDLMFQALRRIPNLNAGRAAFYMSRDMVTMLGRQTVNLTKSSTLTTETVGGKLVERFQGVPVRRVDALSADETLVA